MRKKLLFIVNCIFFSSLIFTYLIADEKELVPLKKPLLTKKEIKDKISVNLLKPLAKPKNKVSTNEPEQIVEKTKNKKKIEL